jgi:hypothetical protein
MSNKHYIIDVQEAPDGDLFIELPQEVLDESGFEIGDTLLWKDMGNGSFQLTKKETEWVMVECISTFRERYMVEVPKGKAEYALDTVTMNEAKEFSQEYLGETIVSHRVVSKEEALTMCDRDNDYIKSWDNETKIKNFFTTLTDQKDAYGHISNDD